MVPPSTTSAHTRPTFLKPRRGASCTPLNQALGGPSAAAPAGGGRALWAPPGAEPHSAWVRPAGFPCVGRKTAQTWLLGASQALSHT